MKTKVVKLTESDLVKIVNRVIKESELPKFVIRRIGDNFLKQYIDRSVEVYFSPCNADDAEYYAEDIINYAVDEAIADMENEMYFQEYYDDVYAFMVERCNELFKDMLIGIYNSSCGQESLTKEDILNMSNEELKNSYGTLEISGEYYGKNGTFHHFKKDMFGNVIASFRTDDETPSGRRKNLKAVKINDENVIFDEY